MHLSAGDGRRSGSVVVALVVVLFVLCGGTSPQPASAYTIVGGGHGGSQVHWGPVSAGPVSALRPSRGVSLRALPVSRTQVSRLLRRATGLSLSQVHARHACAAPSKGRVGCMTSVLVANGTGRPVVPSHRSSASTMVAASGSTSPLTAPAGVSPPTLGTPAFVQWAYDLSYLSATAGSGDTVAIVDAYHDPNAESDLQTYRATFGLPTCDTANGCLQIVNQSGATSPLPSTTDPGGWNIEESLDLDAVSAICPNCHILMVETNGTSFSDLQAGAATAASLGANQISMSFGAVTTYDSSTWTFSGVSSFAATGDAGYVGSGEANFPAANPGVIAVGGTTLQAGANARGFSESAWSGAGSACAGSVTRPSWQPSGSCTTRSIADVSALAAPSTGLGVYDSTGGSSNGWMLVGGTSLATPLAAGYAGLTGVDSTHNGQWAYTDAGHLNDITSGSNGSCGTYICDVGTGYDGPTGNGSISGTVATGGPVVAGEYTSGLTADFTGVTLNGGVYPNGADTTYHWEYGTSTSYGQQTASADAGSGSGLVSVSATLSGLTPGQTYHFRLVVTNSYGTQYGYDQTFTASSAPQNTARPSITDPSGVYQNGYELDASTGTWSYPGTVSYRWKSCTGTSGSGSSATGTGCATISGATSSTYTPLNYTTSEYFVVAVTETNAYGSTTAVSTPTPADSPGPPPANTAAPAIAVPSQGVVTGATLTADPGTWTNSGTITYQWMVTDGGGGFTAISGATSSTYTPTSSDQSYKLRVEVTNTNAGGSATATSTPVGPVTAATTTTDSSQTATATPPKPTVSRRPSLRLVAGRLKLTGGSYRHGSAKTIRYYRCAERCRLVATLPAGRVYRPRAADRGHYMTARVKLTGTGGTTWTKPTRPRLVLSATAGAATIHPRHRHTRARARTSRHRTLAKVTAVRRNRRRLLLRVHAAHHTTITVWACVLKRARVVACTRHRVTHRARRLTVLATRRETVQLIAIKRTR